ncbi:MAG: ABC transporter permease [Acidobacteriota bacterium]
MSAGDLLRFVLGALLGHRLRSALSLLAVGIGVAAVIVLTALGEGARRYVVGQFTQIGSNFVAVVPGKTETTGGIPGIGGTTRDLTLDDARALQRGLSAAEYVEPVAIGTETVSHGELRRQVAVVGGTSNYLVLRKLELERGRALPPLEFDRSAPVCVLGHLVADQLFPGADPIGAVVRIGASRSRVVGVIAPRGKQLGLDVDDMVVIPVATAMQLFNRSSLFRIAIQARSTADLQAIARQARAILIARHGEEDVTVLTEDAVLGAFSSIFNVLTLALAAIASVSLGVAGIGIMNVMLVSVSERTAEIGLLKALGARRRQILLCFLAEAGLLALLGGILGLAVGWGGTRILVAVFPALPASPPSWAVGAALLLAVAVGSGFGWLPARRATLLDPVAALAGR